MIIELPYRDWALSNGYNETIINELEQGKLLFLPHLGFALQPHEQLLLNPQWVDKKKKNITYRADKQTVTGLASQQHHEAVQRLLMRYHQSASQLLNSLFPQYASAFHRPATTLRLHPVNTWRQHNSWRKDDSRLHVDAFPSRPTQGERLIRVFTNINLHNEPRVWRIGESFTTLAQRFFPRLTAYSSTSSYLQQLLRVTKGRRSHYDHLMLQLHDHMKADQHYQQQGQQQTIHFPAGSSWICFSDQTPHAAMSGQYMLEQTFFLPVHALQDINASPLKILEKLVGQPVSLICQPSRSKLAS